MHSNQNNTSIRFLSNVSALEARLDDCIGSQDYVDVIRALVATGDQRAVHVLASLLDSTGPIAEESIAGLVKLAEAGCDVVSAMRACTDSDDYEMIRHAHRVLVAVGNQASKQWLKADDEERIEAYLDRMGLAEEEGLLAVLLANDGSEEEGTA
jgi:hypothetical protein